MDEDGLMEIENIFCRLNGIIMRGKTFLFLAALSLICPSYALPKQPLRGNYTIKVMSCVHENTAVSFIKKHHLKNQVGYFVTRIREKNWYVVTYGNYRSKEEAEHALSKLPASIKNLKPSVVTAKSFLLKKDITEKLPSEGQKNLPSTDVKNLSAPRNDYQERTKLTLPGTDQEPTSNRILNLQEPLAPPLIIPVKPITISQRDFKLPYNFEIKGYGGRHAVGNGQLVMPFWGNEQQSFFGILDGTYGVSSDCGWMGDLGLGYRRIKGERIYGGYLTVSGNSSPSSDKFWVANPGFETLGEIWDFRVNGYLTLSKKSWITSDQNVSKVPASDLGDYSNIYFIGHNVFDNLVDIGLLNREAINSGVGVDAEIGAKIPMLKGLKVYLGGYHFNITDIANITGVSGKITYQINDHVGVEAIDTYDSVRKNKALLGIKFSLGGFTQEEKERFGISARLVDPIEHGIAARFEGTIIPVESKISFIPVKEDSASLIHDNAWFFYPDSSAVNANLVQGDGTFEHPYIGLTQDNFNHINPSIGTIDHYPLLYLNNLNNGNNRYNLETFSSNRFSLPYGWGMYGREDNFKRPGSEENRATFFGGIDLWAGANVLNSLRVFNNSNAQGNGVNIDSASNIHLDNVQIGTLDNSSGTAYDTALNINNAGNVLLDRSQIYGYHAGGEGISVYGMKIDSGNVVLNQGNQVIAEKNNSGFNDIMASTIYGISATNSQLNINNQNDVEAIAKNCDLTGTGVSSITDSYGISLKDSNLMIGNRNTISSSVAGGNIGGVGNAAFPMTSYAIYSESSTPEAITIDSYNNIYASIISRTIIPNQSPVGEGIAALGICQKNGSVSLNNGNNIIATAHASDMGDTQTIKDTYDEVVAAVGIITSNGVVNIGNGNNIYFSTYLGKRNIVHDSSFQTFYFGLVNNMGVYVSYSSIAQTVKIGDNNNIIGVSNCKDFNVDAGPTAANFAAVDVDSALYGIRIIQNSGVPSLIIGNNNLISLSNSFGQANLLNANGYMVTRAYVSNTSYGISFDQFSLFTMGSGNTISTYEQTGSIYEQGGNLVTLGETLVGYGIYSNYTGDDEVQMNSGDNNTINGQITLNSMTSTGGTNVSATVDAEYYGVYRLLLLNLGSNNHFIGNAVGGLANITASTVNLTSLVRTIGIDIISSGPGGKLVISKGGNVFDLTASDPNGILGEAYGMRAEGFGTLVFDFSRIGSNKNIFNVGGNTGSWGIFADSLSYIVDQNGNPITTLTDLLPINDITRKAGYSGGNKIEWVGTGAVVW
jgi:trimeric autotransporter adhesin